MNMHALKGIFLPFFALLGFTLISAQDDVYFEPSSNYFKHYNKIQHQESLQEEDYGVTYYDDEGYPYDSYDGYRYHDDYGYSNPGSSIHISFGWSPWITFGWSGWNYWNYYYPYNHWYAAPYYYGYSGWCGGYYNNWNAYTYNNYWGGCNNYYSYYGSCYNNYYYGNPYYGGYSGGCGYDDWGHHDDWGHDGYYPGTYYGPRVSGNTGSSPRGPIIPPGISQPVLAGKDLADQNDKPVFADIPSGAPGIRNPVTPPAGVDQSPASIPQSRNNDVAHVGKDIPVDKELPRDNTPGGSKRPVFKPAETQRFEPYPTGRNEETASTDPKPRIDRPVYRPYTPSTPRNSAPASNDQPKPNTQTDRPDFKPEQVEPKQDYTPSNPGRESKPDYTPINPGRDAKPDYKPGDPGRNNRPGYSPPSRIDDRPGYAPPGRTRDADREERNDRPSYSPPQRPQSDSNDRPSGRSQSDDRPGYSPRSESPSHSAPSRESSPSSGGRSSGGSNSGGHSPSSGGSSHSSGGSSHSSGGSSGSSASPRGRG